MAQKIALPSPRQAVTALLDSLSSTTSTNTPLPSNRLLEADAQTRKTLVTLHVLFPNETLPALDLLDRGLVTRLQISHIQPVPQPPRDNAAAPQTRQPEQHQERREPQVVQLQAEAGPARPQLPHQNLQPDLLGEDHRTQAARGHAHGAAVHHAAAEPLPERVLEGLRPRPGTYYVRSAQQRNASRSGGSKYRAAAENSTHYEVRLHAWSCSCPAFAFSAFPVYDVDRDDEPAFDGERNLNGARQSACSFGGITRGQDMPVCKHLLACTLVEHGGLFAGLVEERLVSEEEFAGWAAGWVD